MYEENDIDIVDELKYKAVDSVIVEQYEKAIQIIDMLENIKLLSKQGDRYCNEISKSLFGILEGDY